MAVAKVVAMATVRLMVFVYLSGLKIISRAVVLSSASVNLVTLASWRLWKRRVVDREIADGRRARNVLIVGADKGGQQLDRFASRQSATRLCGLRIFGSEQRFRSTRVGASGRTGASGSRQFCG